MKKNKKKKKIIFKVIYFKKEMNLNFKQQNK